MSMYISCKKRSNQPLIHVLICERKCKEKENCKEYNRYLAANAAHVNVPPR